MILIGKPHARTFGLGDWMRSVQNRITSLHVQQVQLHRIFRVDILVRVEELSA